MNEPSSLTEDRLRPPPELAFRELGKIVLGSRPLGEIMHRIAELTALVVPGADDVSITLIEGATVRTAAFTGPLSAALDERQYTDISGPCLDAAQSGVTIRIDDTATDSLYPGFAALARRLGVRSTLAVGLQMPQRILGALNVYLTRPIPLSAEEEDLVRSFAAYATVSLANAALFDNAARLAQNLRLALQSRAIIDQAKGIVMVSLACSEDEAFGRLVKKSQDSNVKLRELAGQIVADAQAGRPVCQW